VYRKPCIDTNEGFALIFDGPFPAMKPSWGKHHSYYSPKGERNMKTVILAVSLGLILFAEVAGAQTGEKTIPRCQQLAYDFAENPDSLKGDRLNQL